MTNATRGRPAFTANKMNVVAALAAVRDGTENTTSYYLTRQLVEKGYLAVESVKRESRGRPSNNYVLTNKGKTYLNFSRNWK